MKITITWMATLLISVIFYKLIQVMKKKQKPLKSKWNQFECGFNSMTPSHIPFSFQFFMVAMLFLIFDVEISAILAYPMETKMTKNKLILMTFLMILTIGLTYEWQKSKLDWSK